jgi:hypothetical protein
MPNPNTPVFPSAVATDSILMVAANRGFSTLALPIDSVQTQITVTNGTVFKYPCLVQIDTEVIYVGTISGNVFESCVRGYALTSATTHAQTAQVKAYIFSYHHNQICAEVKAIEAALGVNLGNVVTQTDTGGRRLDEKLVYVSPGSNWCDSRYVWRIQRQRPTSRASGRAH